MKTLRKSRSSAALVLALAGLLAAPMLTSTTFAAANAPAADSAATTDLFIKAKTAMEAGDLLTARDIYLQLHATAPDDPYVNADLAEIDARLKNSPAPSAPAKDTSSTTVRAGSAPASPASSASSPSSVGATDTSAAPTALPATSAAQVALDAQVAIQNQRMDAIQVAMRKAQTASDSGDYDGARALLAQAKAQVPPGIASEGILDGIKQQTAQTYLNQATVEYGERKNDAAAQNLKLYIALAGNDSSAQNLQAALTVASADPTRQNINDVSPVFVDTKKKIDDLMVKGRAQFLYGDYDGARDSFSEIVRNDPNNYEARVFQTRINTFLYNHAAINHEETREAMILDVEQAWARPDLYVRSDTPEKGKGTPDPLVERLKTIIFPEVDFEPMTLDQVVKQLHDTSARFDANNIPVNISVLPQDVSNPVYPMVSLPPLTGLSLARIIDEICKKTGFSWKVEGGIVTLRYGGASGQFGSNDTRSFPMTQGTLTLILGYHGSSDSPDAASPFTPSGSNTTAPSTDATPSNSQIEDGLQKFFTKVGVLGDDAKLAFSKDGKIYVTASPGSLDRLDEFMRSHYTQVRQVEIEARFLDVQQGKLSELGAQWNVSRAGNPNDYLQTSASVGGAGIDNTLSTLGNAFPLGNSGSQPTEIIGLATSTGPNNGFLTIPQQIPSLPNGINVGSGLAQNFSGILGVLEGYKINAVIQMLEQEQGTDLMSAPTLTVLSTKRASITVAQRLIYPTDFSQIQSNVSPASSSSGNTSGGAGVAITAGTPSAFTTQDVGVTMTILPTVEDDDSIDLNLQPQVTEFEGFIEYGGTSIAIQSGITATVPSGFIQPIFDVRNVSTDVTIFDGATVVIGGLTRDEVKTISDKVPVLGDIPLIGRLFQSKGETSQKRNLMIFVTANLISPGGGLAKQNMPGAPANSLYQMPTVITPARDERREPTVGAAP